MKMLKNILIFFIIILGGLLIKKKMYDEKPQPRPKVIKKRSVIPPVPKAASNPNPFENKKDPIADDKPVKIEKGNILPRRTEPSEMKDGEDFCESIGKKFDGVIKSCSRIVDRRSKLACANRVSVSYFNEFKECSSTIESRIGVYTRSIPKENAVVVTPESVSKERTRKSCTNVIDTGQGRAALNKCRSLGVKAKIMACVNGLMAKAKAQNPKCSNLLDQAFSNFKSK